MVKVDKKNALFLKGVVIANGIPDSDGDILDRKDIKKLISSFLSHQTDTNHDFLQNMGVEIIENYISQTEETISGHKVPIGSWIASMMVWNKEIISLVRQNRLNGYSLANQPDSDIAHDVTYLLNKRKTYSQFKDMDKLTPTFISLVENPSNKIPFEYFSYKTYLTKSRGLEEDNVSEETKELSKIATSLIDVLSSQLGKNMGVGDESITKAAPPQGGVAPAPIQQQYTQPQPAVEPASLQSIDAKLDKLIQIMSGANQIQKAVDDTKKKKVKGDGSSAKTSGHGERTPSTTPKVEEEEEEIVEESGVTENNTDLAGEGGDNNAPKVDGESGGIVSKQEKTNDETGQPQTKESGASLNQVPPTPNNNVQPSNKLQGQTGGRTVLKSAPAQTQNSTISDPVMQSYNTQDIGTKRDALGRPIRD